MSQNNACAYLRFYAELNEFVPAARRQRTVIHSFQGRVSVKHLIEAMGVPHTEVDLILANGASVDFSYLVQDRDRISVYPPFTTIDVSPLRQLRPPSPNPIRFVLDGHLGQLATYLRLLGFDALYRNDFEDDALAQITHEENRVLLTRDRRLLMRKQVVHGYCLRTKDSRQQLLAVLHRFDLFRQIDPWQRCLRCNGRLHPVPKEEIMDRLEPKTKKYYHEFHMCQECGQIYWKGSHYQPLREFIENINNRGDSVQSPVTNDQ